ncbi:Qat anti-phage system TatD family nuclease QatD [Paenibacillus sp. FSL W7-1332]|uniref:Qat anti-phage system TatD family nuclease QatD n=1 Tax=Paenibacillus sp. FSL W7-1332 TaxID=2921702 RepID=UPI0030CD75A8
MKNFVDFHVHIDYYPNYKAIFNSYNNQKIYTLFVTNFPEVFKKAKDTFQESKYVKIALGYHPEMINIRPFKQTSFDKYLEETKYVGEVGLDFSKDHIKNRDEQIRIFRHICRKTADGNKIMSVHSRNAESDVLANLKEYGVKHAVFHWYTGSIKNLQDIIESNFYLSLNPSMLRTKKGKEIIQSIPLRHILIETDGPYSKYNNRQTMPEDIPSMYRDFENFLGIENLRDIVFENLSRLLLAQQKSHC